MRESYQNALAAGIEKRFQNLEYEVMADIVRRIQKAGKITSTADWELQRMQILGKSTADLRKIVASAVQFDDDEVERLYREVVDNEYTVYKDQYLKINRKFVPYEENKELQQITKALTQQSNEDLNNITKSMGFMVRNATGKLEFTPLGEKYNEYLDQAITDMTSGVYDYNTLVRRLVKQMTNSGLRTERPFAENSEDKSGIDYPSGWHNRIDVAARRALLTGFSQLTGQIMDMNAEALHVDRFEVSWHMEPDRSMPHGRERYIQNSSLLTSAVSELVPDCLDGTADMSITCSSREVRERIQMSGWQRKTRRKRKQRLFAAGNITPIRPHRNSASWKPECGHSGKP